MFSLTCNRWTAACGLLCLIGLVGGAAPASALTGVGESALFNLNTVWATGVAQDDVLPRADRLGGCFPNPFNPRTTIRYELAQATAVALKIYDLQGHLVRTLVDLERSEPGAHEAIWDGRGAAGNPAAAGVYLYRLVTDDYSGSQRMTLIK
jgi:hypothetical protein